jgi:hypothetical protein
MTLENFRKYCELLKDKKINKQIVMLQDNLMKHPDEDRKKIFNEVFSEKDIKEKKKDGKQ